MGIGRRPKARFLAPKSIDIQRVIIIQVGLPDRILEIPPKFRIRYAIFAP